MSHDGFHDNINDEKNKGGNLECIKPFFNLKPLVKTVMKVIRSQVEHSTSTRGADWAM